jgi:hypothetical protein
VRVVAATLAVEVHLAIARLEAIAVAAVVIRSILAHEALDRRVALDQRAVDGEVLVAAQPRLHRATHDAVEERGNDAVLL